MIDVEPSAKMVAMIDHLKQWDADSNYSDKTIVYSQCEHFVLNFHVDI